MRAELSNVNGHAGRAAVELRHVVKRQAGMRRGSGGGDAASTLPGGREGGTRRVEVEHTPERTPEKENRASRAVSSAHRREVVLRGTPVMLHKVASHGPGSSSGRGGSSPGQLKVRSVALLSGKGGAHEDDGMQSAGACVKEVATPHGSRYALKVSGQPAPTPSVPSRQTFFPLQRVVGNKPHAHAQYPRCRLSSTSTQTAQLQSKDPSPQA